MTNAIEQYNAAIAQVSRTWEETMAALDRRFPNRGAGGEIEVVREPSLDTRQAWTDGHRAAVAADRAAREAALETLKGSNKLIAWMVERDTWDDYREAALAFLARTPATKSSLFEWAKEERGWCDDFDDLFEAAYAAGALEGLILPEPEDVTSPALAEAQGSPEEIDGSSSTPADVAAAREALLNLGYTHGGGEGRRRVGDALNDIARGGSRDRLLSLAREHGGDEVRDQAAGLLNTAFGGATGAVLPDHLAAREELLRLAGQQAGGDGRRVVADLLDRIDRGRMQVTADDEVEGDEV